MIYQTSDMLFVGIRGVVLALHRRNGQVLWETSLKGWDFVTLVLDNGDLLATAKGEISCLDPATGRIRWTNPLRGYGYGIISIATQGQSSSNPAAAAVAEAARQSDDSAAPMATMNHPA